MSITSENLVIDRPYRGSFIDSTTGEIKVMLNQITNPNWEFSGEQESATDAQGVRVATFNRSKGCRFSAEAKFINTSLLAAQFGKEKTLASSSSKVRTPKYDIITVGFSSGTTPNTSVTLSETPITGTVPYIYKLGEKDCLSGVKYAVADSASATEFAIASDTITLPTTTGALAGTDKILVRYEYEADTGVLIENSSENFGFTGMFELDVLCSDICNPSIKYHGFLIFQNVTMDPNFSINVMTDGTHAFGFEANSDYCSGGNLCYLVMAENA
jgi:hypothetical protein